MKGINIYLNEAAVSNYDKARKELEQASPEEFRVYWTKTISALFSVPRVCFTKLENYENFKEAYKKEFGNDFISDSEDKNFTSILKNNDTTKTGKTIVAIGYIGNKLSTAALSRTNIKTYKKSIDISEFTNSGLSKLK